MHLNIIVHKIVHAWLVSISLYSDSLVNRGGMTFEFGERQHQTLVTLLTYCL